MLGSSFTFLSPLRGTCYRFEKGVGVLGEGRRRSLRTPTQEASTRLSGKKRFLGHTEPGRKKRFLGHTEPGRFLECCIVERIDAEAHQTRLRIFETRELVVRRRQLLRGQHDFR